MRVTNTRFSFEGGRSLPLKMYRRAAVSASSGRIHFTPHTLAPKNSRPLRPTASNWFQIWPTAQKQRKNKSGPKCFFFQPEMDCLWSCVITIIKRCIGWESGGVNNTNKNTKNKKWEKGDGVLCAQSRLLRANSVDDLIHLFYTRTDSLLPGLASSFEKGAWKKWFEIIYSSFGWANALRHRPSYLCGLPKAPPNYEGIHLAEGADKTHRTSHTTHQFSWVPRARPAPI